MFIKFGRFRKGFLPVRLLPFGKLFVQGARVNDALIFAAFSRG